MARPQTKSPNVNQRNRGGTAERKHETNESQTNICGEKALYGRATSAKVDEEELTRCPECESDLITNGGEVMCGECGLVVDEDRVDYGGEWNSFVDRAGGEVGHNVQRCNGGPRDPAHHAHGLGSEIGWSRGSQSKHPLKMKRLRQQDSRSRFESKRQRNLSFAFGEVKRVSSMLSLGRQVQHRACEMLREAQEQDLFVGDVMETMVGGSLYAAIRDYSLGRLPGEIAEALRYTDEDVEGNHGVTKAIQNAYGKLCRNLGIGFEPAKPADHIPRAASQLGVEDEVRNYAISVARAIHGSGDFVARGRTPTGVAAGCIYFAIEACGGLNTQAAIADELGVSAKTLRDNWTDLCDREDLPAIPSDDNPSTTNCDSTVDTGESSPLSDFEDNCEQPSADVDLDVETDADETTVPHGPDSLGTGPSEGTVSGVTGQRGVSDEASTESGTLQGVSEEAEKSAPGTTGEQTAIGDFEEEEDTSSEQPPRNNTTAQGSHTSAAKT